MNSRLLTGLYCLTGGLAGLGMAALWKSPGGSGPPPQAGGQTVPASRTATPAGGKEIQTLLLELPEPEAGSALGRQAAWIARLKKADVAEMKTMLEDARKNADPYERRLYREMVFTKWIQQNAEEAYAYSKVYDDGRVKAQFVFYWARTNPDQAWETFSREGSSTYKRWTLDVMAEETPGRFLDMLSDPERSRSMDGASVRMAVLKDGKRNTQADAEAALKLAEAPGRESLLDATCLLWAQRDPEAAAKWAKEIADPELRQAAVAGVLRELATRDPKAAAAEFHQQKNATWSLLLANDVAAGLAKLEPGQEKAYLNGYSAKARNSILLGGLIPAMERLETGAVMPLLENYWDPKAAAAEDGPALGALSKWVPDDPGREWTALAAFPESAAKSELARVLAPQLARSNPAAAQQAAELSKDPALRNILGRELASGCIQKEDEAGFLKAISVMQGQPLTKAVYDMTRELSENAPNMDRAIDFASRQTGAARAPAMEQVAWLWSWRDPEAALSWAVEGGEPFKPAFQQNLLARWAKEDSFAASAWLDSLPAGSQRDAYASGLISTIAAAEPDSAFTWSQTINDPAARRKWSEWTVQQWAKQDPAAAWQAVESAKMDDQARVALRAALAQKQEAASKPAK